MLRPITGHSVKSQRSFIDLPLSFLLYRVLRKDDAEGGDYYTDPLAGVEEFVAEDPGYDGCGDRDEGREYAGFGDSEVLYRADPQRESKA